LRSKESKTTALIFHSGKIVCTGAKTLEQVKRSVESVVKSVKGVGIQINDNPPYEVQNIVASSDLGQPIDLTSVVLSLGLETVEYEPEVFPGLVYRMNEPKVVFLLFGSGRLVCVGARKPQDVEIAVDKLTEELRAAELLH
jgi:transcription initiation factor TFIID TATA-box-binding protein